MRALRGELLLQAWERGAGQSDIDRPLTLLAVACPGRSWDELMDLSMVQRELELLLLRRITFGDDLKAYVSCLSCAARLEFEVHVSSIIDSISNLSGPAEAGWRHQSAVFSMRQVTTRDLVALSSALEPRSHLLALCTRSDMADGPTVADCEAIAVEQFNGLNEGAETRFSLRCAECSEIGEMDLDIGRFLWAEVRHAAMAAFRDVHDLAAAYGWSETEILGMSSMRRAMYLGMTRA
ncbi:MAG TPA: hypothetical protein VGJ33_10935 [Candidatus Angelobacter sp.]|jgi:hypothetical protein